MGWRGWSDFLYSIEKNQKIKIHYCILISDFFLTSYRIISTLSTPFAFCYVVSTQLYASLRKGLRMTEIKQDSFAFLMIFS